MRADFGEDFTHLVGVVVGERDGVIGERGRHAGRARHAERQRAGTGLDQQGVAVAVVATLELDDLVAPGIAAREADRAHRRLGAGIGHADLVEARHDRADALGELDLERAGRAEAQAARRGFDHRADDLGMRVAGDHRPPRADIVDVALAVDVDQARALGARDERRRAADRLEGAHRRIDSAGNDPRGALEEFFGLCHGFRVR